jgi:hypothetical protein
MSQNPKDERSLPHFIAQAIGELTVRIEKLERRTEYQGKAIKSLVSQNRSLRSRLARANGTPSANSVEKTPPVRKPSKPAAEPAIDEYDDLPDFTAPLRELRKTH